MFIPASKPSNRNQQFFMFLQVFCAHTRLPFLLCENICHRLLFSPRHFPCCLPHNVNFILENNFGQHLISFMCLLECLATGVFNSLRLSSFLQSNFDPILWDLNRGENLFIARDSWLAHKPTGKVQPSRKRLYWLNRSEDFPSTHCSPPAAEGEIIISGLGFIFNAAPYPGTECQEFRLNLHSKWISTRTRSQKENFPLFAFRKDKLVAKKFKANIGCKIWVGFRRLKLSRG